MSLDNRTRSCLVLILRIPRMLSGQNERPLEM